MRIHLFSKKISKEAKQAIRIGDICFLYENSCLYLWIENNKEEQKSNGLSSVLVADNVNIKFLPKSESLIFSYNGLNQRTGDISSLEVLASILKNKKILDIVKNAIDILEFKEDRLDILSVTHLVEFLKKQQSLQWTPTENISKASSESKEQTNKPKLVENKINTRKALTTKENKPIYPPQAYYFYDYLGESEQMFWRAQYKNLVPHDIFKEIRQKNKIGYSKAFDLFVKDYPKLHIYSIKEEYTSIAVGTTSSTKQVFERETKSFHDLLIENGYQQIDANLWKMPTGQFFRIQILESVEISPSTTNQVNCEEFKDSSSSYIYPNIISAVDENKLKETFKHVATTYKFFWFLAIVSLARNRRTEKLLFTELVARMISLAYPYIEKRFNFGHIDKIPDITHKLIFYKILRTSFSFQTNETKIIASFENFKYKYILNQLLQNVPYRFLSPWITFTNNKDVMDKSNDVHFHVPYSIHSDHILLNEIWHKFFKDKYDDLFKFTQSELGKYLEHYNSKVL